MEQLKVKDLMATINHLISKYGKKKAMEMQVYLGDDDELNGIHSGWDITIIDTTDENDPDFESSVVLAEMIEDEGCNAPIENEIALLIS